MVELREADDSIAEFVHRVVTGLRIELFHIERMAFESRRRFSRRETFLRHRLNRADAPEMSDEETDERGDRARNRIPGTVEERLASKERRAKVPSSPRVGQLVARNLRAARGE